MKSIRNNVLALIALYLFSAAPSAFAEAWLQTPGKLYLKVSGSISESKNEYNFRGDEQELFFEDGTRSDSKFREIATRVYAEYGLATWLTVVGQLPLKNVRTWETIVAISNADPQEAIRTNYGFGDLELHGRVPILRGPLAVATQFGLKIPLGYDDTPWNEGPALGTGEVDGDIRLAVGRGLDRGWVEISMGYHLRGGPLSNEWRISTEGGWRPRAKWYAKLRYEGLRNEISPIDIGGIIIETPAPPGVLNQVVIGDQDYDILGGEINYQLTPLWAVSGEATHVLSGKNTLTGTTFQVSLIYSN